MKALKTLLVLVMFMSISCLAFALADKPGFKDPELFTRMPRYAGTDYKTKEYDKFDFIVAKGKDNRKRVEGKYYWLGYQLDPKAGRSVSNLQVIRNFQNAATKQGGKVIFDDGGYGMFHHTTIMIPQKGSETWVQVRAVADKRFELVIVEKQAMEQEVVANPMLDSIKQTGKVTLYINFDTNKATIKPDSLKTVDEIVEMMNAESSLKISIEGHTDNTGNAAANQKLSEARAKSVMHAVAAKGVNRARMTAQGFGMSKPVAENTTEEGKAKNRRVELVRQ